MTKPATPTTQRVAVHDYVNPDVILDPDATIDFTLPSGATLRVGIRGNTLDINDTSGNMLAVIPVANNVVELASVARDTRKALGL